MSNMSYCRFRNTLADLLDCQEHLLEELSTEEEKARAELVRTCQEIVEAAGEEYL